MNELNFKIFLKHLAKKIRFFQVFFRLRNRARIFSHATLKPFPTPTKSQRGLPRPPTHSLPRRAAHPTADGGDVRCGGPRAEGLTANHTRGSAAVWAFGVGCPLPYRATRPHLPRPVRCIPCKSVPSAQPRFSPALHTLPPLTPHQATDTDRVRFIRLQFGPRWVTTAALVSPLLRVVAPLALHAPWMFRFWITAGNLASNGTCFHTSQQEIWSSPLNRALLPHWPNIEALIK